MGHMVEHTAPIDVSIGEPCDTLVLEANAAMCRRSIHRACTRANRSSDTAVQTSPLIPSSSDNRHQLFVFRGIPFPRSDCSRNRAVPGPAISARMMLGKTSIVRWNRITPCLSP